MIQVTGFDVETYGDLDEYMLQPFRALSGKAGIKAASTSDGADAGGSLYPDTKALRTMLRTTIADGTYITGWNTSFDAAWCIAVGLEDLVFEARWLDAMLLWRHAVVEPEGEDVPQNKRKRYSLEAAMQEFYPDDADFKEFKDFAAEDDDSLDRLLHRNKMDALWTARLAQKFWGMLSAKQRIAALIEARCIPLIAKTRVMGIRSSIQAAQTLSDTLAAEAVSIYRSLLASSPEVRGINLNSPPQLQKLLYDTWGLPADRFSKKTGMPSTDKYALFDLASLDPRARELKKLREAKNNRKKYAIGTINSMEYNNDDYVRPQAKIFSTYTSRITYGSSDTAAREVEKTTKKNGTEWVKKNVSVPVGIALHQWKRGKDYRRLIQAPEGFLLGELDAAGQEFRWMAFASGDETMLSLCADGEDAHSYMGAQVAHVDYRELVEAVGRSDAHAEMQRKLGKFSNLSFQYRVGVKTATTKARVDYELDIDEMEIKRLLSTYKSTYPGVGGHPGQRDGGYWGNQIRKCKSLGYAETFAGRRVQLKGNWAGRDAWPMESSAINYPIQGTGGDQKYLAMAVARNYLPEFGGYFYYELHDGLFFIFPEDKAVKAMHKLRDVLSNLPYKKAWGVDLPITFPFDAKIGPTWGDLVDLEKFRK